MTSTNNTNANLLDAILNNTPATVAAEATRPVIETPASPWLKPTGNRMFEPHERGLDWTVSLHPVSTGLDGSTLPGVNAVHRDDTGAFLGTVGDTYRPIQNATLASVLDELEERGIVSPASDGGAVGSFKGGRQVYMQGQLAGMYGDVKGGDTIAQRFTFVTSHDGTIAGTCSLTTVRIVCQNTMRMSISKEMTAALLKFRHTTSAVEKIKSLPELIAGAYDAFQNDLGLYRAMAACEMTDAQYYAFLTALFGSESNKKELGKSTKERSERIIERALPKTADAMAADLAPRYAPLRNIWEDSTAGTQIDRGTAWGAFNAVTEYVDHIVTPRGDNGSKASQRVASSMLGTGAKKREEAAHILKEIVLAAN